MLTLFGLLSKIPLIPRESRVSQSNIRPKFPALCRQSHVGAARLRPAHSALLAAARRRHHLWWAGRFSYFSASVPGSGAGNGSLKIEKY